LRLRYGQDKVCNDCDSRPVCTSPDGQSVAIDPKPSAISDDISFRPGIISISSAAYLSFLFAFYMAYA
jgi:hypothetical protein